MVRRHKVKMRRVNLNDIVAGMITAERVTNYHYDILLEENTKVTEQHIALLKTWEVDFIRIREPNDTYESLKEQLIKDRKEFAEEKKKELLEKQLDDEDLLGITTDNILSILLGNGDDNLYSEKRDFVKIKNIKVTSLLDKEVLKEYNELSAKLSLILNTGALKRDIFIQDSIELAVRTTQFILKTVGVIGYCLYPQNQAKPILIEHTLRTTVIAGKIAQLLGYSPEEISKVILGALLHDLGCVDLPEELFSQEYTLSLEEKKRDAFKKHVTNGVNLLKYKNLPQEVLLIVGGHHEMMDGSGYPLRLDGNRIHPYARIVSLANAVDVVMYPIDNNDKAINLSQLIYELPLWVKQYDATMCMELQKYLLDFIMSNRITLNDGRIAELIWQHSTYKSPIVKTGNGEIVNLNDINEITVDSYYI